MGDDDLTIQQAAQELGVTTEAVFYLVKRGRLPAHRFGRQWAIRRADLETFRVDWERRQRPGPAPEAKRRAA
mgnify:CR=1 FL=1